MEMIRTQSLLEARLGETPHAKIAGCIQWLPSSKNAGLCEGRRALIFAPDVFVAALACAPGFSGQS